MCDDTNNVTSDGGHYSTVDAGMLEHPVEVKVTVVGNPSMNVQTSSIILRNALLPDICELFNEIEIMCSYQSFRVYWRLTEEEFMPIDGFVGLKGALNMLDMPEFYAVTDERITPPQKINEADPGVQKFLKDYDASSISVMSDVEALKCALSTKESTEDPIVLLDYAFTKTHLVFTREWKDIRRQLNILMKGFPTPKKKTDLEILPDKEPRHSTPRSAPSTKPGKKK